MVMVRPVAPTQPHLGRLRVERQHRGRVQRDADGLRAGLGQDGGSRLDVGPEIFGRGHRFVDRGGGVILVALFEHRSQDVVIADPEGEDLGDGILAVLPGLG